MPRAELATAKEAAAFLRCSVRSIYNRCRGYYDAGRGPQRVARMLPFIRDGKRLLFKWPDLERYAGLR